jgi:hypothetical protein
MKEIIVGIFLLFQAVQGSEWYYNNWCGGDMPYLLDENCAKKFPAVYNREWKCPIPPESSVPEGFFPEGKLSDTKIDTTSLAKYVTDPAINLCLIVTKRVADNSPQGFSLYNRYFCAGDNSIEEGYETWSRSIFLSF